MTHPPLWSIVVVVQLVQLVTDVHEVQLVEQGRQLLEASGYVPAVQTVTQAPLTKLNPVWHVVHNPEGGAQT